MARSTKYLFLLLALFALSACSTVRSLAPALATTVPQSGTTTYTVQPGDTLSQIAARYHVTVDQLVEQNSDRYPILSQDPTKLRPGFQLSIPNPAPTDSPRLAEQPTFPNLDLNLATRQIVDGVNSARVGQGLKPLQVDPTLSKMAQTRSHDMVDRNYFSHYDPATGQEALLVNLTSNNYSYRYAGENIAEVQNEANWVPSLLSVAARYSAIDLSSEFVKGWLNSPDHRENIMNSHFGRTGVGIVYSQDGRRIVATQLFSN